MEGKLEHILVRKQLVAIDSLDEMATTFTPSPDHLSLINKYTLEPVQADQVRAFPMLAMNDAIDRDWEQFTTNCINKLAGSKGDSGPLGKSFILSHVSRELGNGRIYFAESVTASNVTHLKTWVYVPNTPQYQDFIENLVYGVYWAVSVGVSVAKANCSVCGVDWPRNFMWECENNHQRGMKYDGTLCWRAIDLVGELYELSSVYLGSQYGAEVVKKMANESGRSLEVIRNAISVVNARGEEEGGRLDPKDVVPDSDIDEKSVVPYKSYPLAPETEAWSFSGADGNALLGADGTDWAKFKSAHTWFDPANKEAKDGYKLPHHKIIGGSMKTVWRGVMAAGNVMMGARGGANIPASDTDGVKGHLAKHYKEFDKTPPWVVPKIAILVEEGAMLEFTEDGLLQIMKGKKVWEYDGTRVIRKEVRQMSGEIERLTKELDTRTDELEAMEAKADNFEEKVAQVEAEKAALAKEVEDLKVEVASKNSVVEHYLTSIRDNVIKWYKLSKGTEEGAEVDTTVLVRLLDKCGDDPELLLQLEADFKEQAGKNFPDLVRRSSVEETEDFEEKKVPPATDDDGIANDIHG